MRDISPDKIVKGLKALARELFTFNLLLHGPSALLYAYGLGSCRYIEYALAFSLFKRGGRLLDIGCGRSLFPSFLARRGFDVVCVDIDRSALMWQRAHGVEAVMADATLLPFRNSTFEHICAISSIEHIPGDGDKRAVAEMLRVLRKKGRGLITVPFSHEYSVISDEFYGIPGWVRKPFSSFIRALMRRLGIERRGGYFVRIYDNVSLRRRILQRLRGCDVFTLFFDNSLAKFAHKIVPMSTVSVLELLMALWATVVSEQGGSGVAIFFSKHDGTADEEVGERAGHGLV